MKNKKKTVQAENAILFYENQTKITSLSDIFTFLLYYASSAMGT